MGMSGPWPSIMMVSIGRLKLFSACAPAPPRHPALHNPETSHPSAPSAPPSPPQMPPPAALPAAQPAATRQARGGSHARAS